MWMCEWVGGCLGKHPHLQQELGVVVEASHSALEHFDLDQLLLLHRVLVSVRVWRLTTPRQSGCDQSHHHDRSYRNMSCDVIACK